METTSGGRSLAIACGLTFTVGALTILLGKHLINPSEWTTYHVLTVLTVFGTIAAGHQITTAWRAGSFACLGYLAVFVAGTCLVVYNSVGNQAEKTGTETMSTEARNDDIATARSDLRKARQRKDYADEQVQRETRNKRCGNACRDWKQNSSDIAVVIRNLERDIASLGPQKPVNAKAENMAEIAALLGFDKAKAKAALMLIEPFLWTLFFEIGSIVSFGFAFRHSPVTVSKVSEAEIVPETPVRGGGNGGGGGLRLVTGETVEDRELTALRLALTGNRSLTNDELADLMGVGKAEASRRVTRAKELGMVSRVRNGRHVAISLSQYAH